MHYMDDGMGIVKAINFMISINKTYGFNIIIIKIYHYKSGRFNVAG